MKMIKTANKIVKRNNRKKSIITLSFSFLLNIKLDK